MEQDLTVKTIQTYNSIASEYEKKSFHLDAAIDVEKFIKLLSPGGKILDAGCGYGRELRIFIDHGFEAQGIDMSTGLLALAKKRNPYVNIQEMDVRNLRFEDCFFDAIWCRAVLHHLPREDTPKVLLEFGRILKPGGVLFVHCRKGTGHIVLKENLSSGQERLFTQFSEEGLKENVQTAGFTVLEDYSYNERERYGEGRSDANFVAVIAKKID